MQHPGWALVFAGVLIAAIGLVWILAPSMPWLGRLPATQFFILRRYARGTQGGTP